MRNKWLDSFLQEADDLLAQIEESALALGENAPAEDTVHQLFRAFHTIKGSGSMCGLTKVAGFTHHVETLLDDVRAGNVSVSPELVAVVLASADHIKLLLAAEQTGEAVPADAENALVEKLHALSGAPETPQPAAANAGGLDSVVCGDAAHKWNIRFQASPALFSCGGNPLLLLKDLRTLGSCDIQADMSRIPDLENLQPDTCYLGWNVSLTTSADLNAIQDVFLFFEDGSELAIEPCEASVPEEVSAGSQRSEPQISAQEPAGSAAKVAPANAKNAVKESTVRVPASRLDRLVNLVGELVMNQSRLAQAASLVGVPEIANPVQEMDRLVAELRDDVLGIRMLPIGTIFGRFRRLVHDLSAELGKETELFTEGAETELDKSILDQLGEPLVHLLRNCIDHAIEPPEERIAAGKPRHGAIRLTAEHMGSNVVIRIQDDGRGMNRAAIRSKAIERQLIAADAVLADRDLLNLILLPGFSTAKSITSVSGRGVGMDVVKRQIDALRGSLSIASEEGVGTTVSLSLPLTLAIIEGLIVQLGKDQFIIPMAAITENVELTRAQRRRNNGRNVVEVRGELIPYIDLRALFQVEGEAPPIEKIVIVHYDEDRVGLVVDRVLGTHQTVLQALGRFFRKVDVVSGATIMGDGSVALIMDIAAVVRFASRTSTSSDIPGHFAGISAGMNRPSSTAVAP